MSEEDEVTREGEIARDFLGRIGSKIRDIRTERRLTVQQLADRAQISRRLLTQIELGQANPSLVAITRIARQLDTDFPTMLAAAETDDSAVDVYPEASHMLVWSSGGSTAHLLASTSEARTADLWRWRLAPGDSYQGRADTDNSQELFYVMQGTLTIVADGKTEEIPAGSSARLRSDRSYEYLNSGSSVLVFVRTVVLRS